MNTTLKRLTPLALCLVAAAAAVPTVASAQPNQKPEARQPDGEQRRGQRPAGRYLEMLQAELQKLDLSEEQQTQVKTLVAELRIDLKSIMQQNKGDREATRQAARERMSRFRASIQETLTADQAEQLKESMKQLRQDRPQRRDRANRPEQGSRPSMERGRRGGFGPTTQPRVDREPGRFESRLADRADGGRIEALSLDLPLLTPTGRETTLASGLAENRPTVLVLGSYSAPSFRERMKDLPWLLDTLRDDGSRNADVLVVYTKERHPADGWTNPRNEEEGVAIPAHASADDRVAAANQVREALGDRSGLTVLLDSMDDTLHARVAGDRPGDHVLILRPDGTVAARQRWFDPTAIPELVANSR
jgi:Spy/CpxP family protein refolding chaperone